MRGASLEGGEPIRTGGHTEACTNIKTSKCKPIGSELGVSCSDLGGWRELGASWSELGGWRELGAPSLPLTPLTPSHSPHSLSLPSHSLLLLSLSLASSHFLLLPSLPLAPLLLPLTPSHSPCSLSLLSCSL